MSERTDTERIEGLARLGIDTMGNSKGDVVSTYVRHNGDVDLLRQAIDAALDAEDPDEHEEAWRCPWCGDAEGCCGEHQPMPPFYRCTRDPGHKPPHAACAREPDVRHKPLAVWGKP